jgi:hypothetical protein
MPARLTGQIEHVTCTDDESGFTLDPPQLPYISLQNHMKKISQDSEIVFTHAFGGRSPRYRT